jgi:hypothetical protein
MRLSRRWDRFINSSFGTNKRIYRLLPNLRNFLIQGSAQNSTFFLWKQLLNSAVSYSRQSTVSACVKIGEKCVLWLPKSCGDGIEGVGNRNEQEFKQIPSFSRVARDRNELKFLRKESAIQGKVSHFLIQGSAAFCYFFKLALS